MQIRHQTCLSHVHARPACAYQQGQSTTDVLHSSTPRCFTVPPPLPEADHHLRDYHQAHPSIQGCRPSLQASRSDCSQPTGGARVPSHANHQTLPQGLLPCPFCHFSWLCPAAAWPSQQTSHQRSTHTAHAAWGSLGPETSWGTPETLRDLIDWSNTSENTGGERGGGNLQIILNWNQTKEMKVLGREASPFWGYLS